MFCGGMQELLKELDPDFYREARLHMAHVELEHLRRERSSLAEVERRAKIPLGKSRPGDAIAARIRGAKTALFR
jgi:hypothetical protein